MSNPLAPYLPYLKEYSTYLTCIDNEIACGDLEQVLAQEDKDLYGCNTCQWSTCNEKCLFNSDDPLYSIFQDYLHTHHIELFI